MFTLYRIGFCSVSKVAPVQCEQELRFCCGAEIVPKRSQCEQKPYPLCNLQRSLLIWKDNLPIRGSVAISAAIKVFRLDTDRLKNLSDTERSTFNSGAEQYCSRAETASKAAFLVWTEALSGALSATLRFTIRYSVNIALKAYSFNCSNIWIVLNFKSNEPLRIKFVFFLVPWDFWQWISFNDKNFLSL